MSWRFIIIGAFMFLGLSVLLGVCSGYWLGSHAPSAALRTTDSVYEGDVVGIPPQPLVGGGHGIPGAFSENGNLSWKVSRGNITNIKTAKSTPTPIKSGKGLEFIEGLEVVGIGVGNVMINAPAAQNERAVKGVSMTGIERSFKYSSTYEHKELTPVAVVTKPTQPVQGKVKSYAQVLSESKAANKTANKATASKSSSRDHGFKVVESQY